MAITKIKTESLGMVYPWTGLVSHYPDHYEVHVCYQLTKAVEYQMAAMAIRASFKGTETNLIPEYKKMAVTRIIKIMEKLAEGDFFVGLAEWEVLG